MFQEDGKLRYIEGVDNGDAPAHDGTYEAEKMYTLLGRSWQYLMNLPL